MNIKSWLEAGTTLDWKEQRYLVAPPLPYFIFIDDMKIRGADNLNNIIEHNLTLEYYWETENNDNDKKIRDFLNSKELHYEINKEWLSDESMWITIYEIDTFIEKVRKEA